MTAWHTRIRATELVFYSLSNLSTFLVLALIRCLVVSYWYVTYRCCSTQKTDKRHQQTFLILVNKALWTIRASWVWWSFTLCFRVMYASFPPSHGYLTCYPWTCLIKQLHCAILNWHSRKIHSPWQECKYLNFSATSYLCQGSLVYRRSQLYKGKSFVIKPWLLQTLCVECVLILTLCRWQNSMPFKTCHKIFLTVFSSSPFGHFSRSSKTVWSTNSNTK